MAGLILFGETKPRLPLPKFVSGRWDYSNNGGSLTLPAHQIVSGGWDNRGMERKLPSVFIALCLFASSTASVAPANAIFGLSKCEKVRKEVRTIETKFFSDYKSIRANPIKDGENDVLALTTQSVKVIDQIKNNDPIPKIWKIGFNNPKCFTNTQNIQIKNMTNKLITNYFDYKAFFSSKPGCFSLQIGLIKDEKALEKCSQPKVMVWKPITEYKSIYSY